MKICVVGLGVIGGSFLMQLKKAGYDNVLGVDCDEETVQRALDSGLICEGSTQASVCLQQADLTILCLYPRAVRPFLEQNGSNLKSGSILTDTTGIKGCLVDEVVAVIPKEVDFIFGHPMAGREKKGFAYASGSVFEGANYIITPLPFNHPDHIELIRTLALKLGFGRVTLLSPQEHDRLIAYTSQLPHAMAVALVNSDEEGRNTGAFIGDSYRDLTRIAKINEALWSELFLLNRENLLMSIERFESELDRIKEALVKQDRLALCHLFQRSTARREKLDQTSKAKD